MANIANVINVSVNLEGSSASRDNMNIIALITRERGNVLSSANRARTYKNASEVALDFGTNSATYAHALTAFSQSPNFSNVGGELAIIYHRSKEEIVEAETSFLRGAQFDEEAIVENLRKIKDGSFKLGEVIIQNLNFSYCSDMNDCIEVIKKGIPVILPQVDNDDDNNDTTPTVSQIIISYQKNRIAFENVSGFAEVAESGTFIGDILLISEGSGAKYYNATEEQVLQPETVLEAVEKGKQLVNFKGFAIITQVLDSDILKLAEWANGNAMLYYEVFSSQDNLKINENNTVWDITLSSFTNTRMLFDDTNDRKLATAYMARMHSINFSAENTAITMHLKTLSNITAKEYSQDTISKAKKVGLDIYTTIKDKPCLLTSGANDFTDNRYNILAFIDALETDAFNLLKTTATKIGQDQQGIDQIVDCVEKTCRGFVKAGVFSAGEWSSSDTFGDIEQFKRNIRENGFFVKAGSLSEQIQSERKERKSPPIQIAVKMKGAVHSIDIIVNLNY